MGPPSPRPGDNRERARGARCLAHVHGFCQAGLCDDGDRLLLVKLGCVCDDADTRSDDDVYDMMMCTHSSCKYGR